MFTEREIKVLELAKEGYTNRDIAKKLNVTIHTIKANLSAIYNKLGVSNRILAILKYLELCEKEFSKE